VTQSVGEYTAPRDELESKLAEIWRMTLGRSPIGIDQDYFELGGDSLRAARLLEQISAAFGIKFPLTVLFQAPTIAALAELIRDQKEPQKAMAAEVRGGNECAPLFFVPGIYGEVLFSREIAIRLRSGYPVYALQPRGNDGYLGDCSIPEIAADYVRQIRDVQQKGPFMLIGNCWGGIVAFEIAQQLLGQGEEIALLALVNTPFPASLRRGPLRQIAHLSRRILFFIEKVYTLKPHQRLGYLSYMIRAFRDRMVATLKSTTLRAVNGLSALFRLQAGELRLTAFEINLEAAKSYTPKPYSGGLTYFWCERPLSPLLTRPAIGAWGELAGGSFKLIRIPGDNESTLLEPFIGDLAGKLDACLAVASSCPSSLPASY
jgi:pimeloyl-ACP methyl ester carboxylesterase